MGRIADRVAQDVLNGAAQQLRILNAVPGSSTLKGRVRRGGTGSTGRTSLPLLLGANHVHLALKSFEIGSISRAPVSQSLTGHPTPGHSKRHKHSG